MNSGTKPKASDVWANNSQELWIRWPCGLWYVGKVIISLNQGYQYLRRPLFKDQCASPCEISYSETFVLRVPLISSVPSLESSFLATCWCRDFESSWGAMEWPQAAKQRIWKKIRVWRHVLIATYLQWIMPCLIFILILYKIYPNTYNILEVRKPRDPNDLFFPLKFSLSMYYMTPSIRTRVTGGWHWCRAIESAEMVQGEASMPVQTSEVKMSVNKIAHLRSFSVFKYSYVICDFH